MPEATVSSASAASSSAPSSTAATTPTAAALATAPTPTASEGPPGFCGEAVAEHARPYLGGLEALGPLEAMSADAAREAGAWTWINLWATWCGPCVKELPRLLAWQRGALGGVPFRLLLVSLDEDRAEVVDFLKVEASPEPDGSPGAAADVQGVYWLPLAARPSFFGTLGLSPMGMLPVQVLVDPQGRVRCAHGGAVRAQHQAAAAALLKTATPVERPATSPAPTAAR